MDEWDGWVDSCELFQGTVVNSPAPQRTLSSATAGRTKPSLPEAEEGKSVVLHFGMSQ
jgi:hypothetical protein